MSHPRKYEPIKLSPKIKAITMPSSRASVGIRYIRADSQPNWIQRVKEKEGDAELISTKPPETINVNSPILEALEKIASRDIRGLIVTDTKETLKGIIMATDLVNYLGGGEYYRIVEQRYKKDVYTSLRNEKISSIMNSMPVFVNKSQKLTEIIRLMAVNGLGMLPVVNNENKVIGIITEHDIVRYIAYKNVGRKVSDIMTSNIVAAFDNDTLKRAAQLMSLYGFRRIPVISSKNNEIVGIVSAKDFVSYFGSHKAFENVRSLDIEEILKMPITEIIKDNVYTINQDTDIGDAATLMNQFNTNNLIVINDNREALGIITERDVLIALSMR
ncbi:MAG: CBS domain-containing protein [Caldisphaera sp.]|nr:MAG: signal transduction protein [Caldisphaera sp.]PMP92007.1 MAG: signal transduction protein [Caldisphaera sp.]